MSDAREPGGAAEESVLDFSELHHNIEAFLQRFDKYVHDTVAASENGRISAASQRAEDYHRIETLEKQREDLKDAQKELWEKRDADAKLRASVQALHAQRTSLVQRTSEIQGEVAELRAQLKTRCAHKDAQEKKLLAEVQRNKPELEQLEFFTGCRITPTQRSGTIEVAFSLLSTDEPQREYSVCLDVSQAKYSVPSHDVLLAQATCDALLKELNATGNVYAFFTAVRSAFKDAIAAKTER